MADKAVFEIIVTEKGLKINQKNVEALGRAVQDTAKKTRESSKAQDELNYKLNQGTTGVSSAAKSFSKLSQAIGSGPNGLVGAYATLAANAFAVSAAFNALRSAQQAQMVLEGLEAQGAKTGKTLTIAADKLREVVGYGISAQDSMKATAQFTAAGFGTDELEKLGKVAQNTSLALGRNLPDSLDRLIKGTTKLEPELLDELGIMTKLSDSSAAYALKTGKTATSLTQFEKRQAFLNAVLAEGELKFGGISDAVKTNPYDRLASAFDNLTVSALGFINNTGIISFIELLSNNTYSLLGVLLLFGSTIQKSLLGSLTDLSSKSVKAAIAARELANEARNAAAAELEGAKAKDLIALQEARAINLHSKSTKAIKDRADAIKEGTLSEEEFDRVLKANQRSIASHTSILERDKKAGIDTSAREQLIKELEDQGSALDRLKKQEADYANNTTKLQGAALSSVRTEFALTRKARAQDAAATAIQAASNLELATTFEFLSTSIRNYSIALQLETKDKITSAAASGILGAAQVRLIGIFNVTKVAVFAASTAIKGLAAGMLRLIPYVGMVLVALDLLKEGWNWISMKIWPNSAKAQLELANTTEEYNKILDTQVKSIEYYSKIQNNTASANSRATAALLNQANALIELADGFNKVIEAQKKKQEADKLDEELRKATTTTGGPINSVRNQELARAKQWSIGVDSLAMSLGSTAMEESRKRWFSGLRDNDEAAQQFVSTVSVLEKRLGKEGLTKAIELSAGSIDKFKKLDWAKQWDIINNILQKTAEEQTRIKEGVEGLNSAFKAGETAASKFFKDAIGTTPFDDIVGSFEDINKNLRILQREGKTAFEQIQLISGVGPELQKFLSPETSTLLDNLREADIVYQSLKDRENQLVGVEKQRFESAKSTLQANEENLPKLKAALQAAEEENKLRQATVALAKAQASLLQAQLSKYSQFLNSGAEGMRAQVKAQREINSLNAAAQAAQKAVLDSMIAQEDLKLRALENELEELKAKQLSLSVDKQKTLELAKQYQLYFTMGQFGPLKDGYITSPGFMDPNKAIVEAQVAVDEDQKKIDQLTDRIESMKNALRTARLNSEALRLSIAAATESSLTRTQENKKAILAEKEATARKNAEVRKTEDERAKADTAQNELIATRNGLLDTTSYKLKQINSEYEAGIRALSTLDDQKSILVAQKAFAESMLTTAPENMRAGIQENIKELQTQIIAITNQSFAMRTTIDDQRIINTYQAIGLNTAKERLEVQRELLSYSQKEMDVWQELQTIKYQNKSISKSMAAQITGATIDTSVKDAEEALRKAKESSELRRQDIELEYGLLEEQRRLLADSLRDKAEAARGIGDVERAGQLTELSTLADQGAARISNAKIAALEVLTAGIEQKQLEAAKARISQYTNILLDNFKKLGPDGEAAMVIFSGMSQITTFVTDAFKSVSEAGVSTASKIEAIAGAAAQAIGAVSSMLNAITSAKIAAVDKEIAAEQKRDGKSAESVAKLDALEKKKDAMAKKSFNVQKKLMMAQAVMATAAGVAGALSASAYLTPMGAAIMAGIIGAMGMAQIALIAGTQYESSYTPKSVQTPSAINIGKRDNTVDLAKGPNANVGGEVSYLRGSEGIGSNASNYRTIGSAYGGELMRGYGNRGFVVGEKGPEVITPETPISVTPANDVQGGSPINANISIHAIDSQGVQDVLVSQKGNIIKMLRDAANASGQRFMEDVNVNVYTRPNVGKL